VTDDPWRKPDRNESPPPPAPPPVYGSPPAYGPQPGYAPPPGPPPAYGPAPGSPGFNPYAAPPPQRSIKRLVLIVSIVALLALGGCGVGIYYIFRNVGKNADTVNAFLRNVRDQRFGAAYGQLCPAARAAQSAGTFVQDLTSAAARGHGVTSFDINSVNTTSTNGVTTRTAGGAVRFADGANRTITFTLGKSGSRLCVFSGYQLLT
jgi:hypothetical protein